MNFSVSDRRKPNGLLKNSAILSAGVWRKCVQHVFQVVMGRLFSVDEFGLLSSLLGVNMLMLCWCGCVGDYAYGGEWMERVGEVMFVFVAWCLIRLGGLGLLVNVFICFPTPW